MPSFSVGLPSVFSIEITIDVTKSIPWIYGEFAYHTKHKDVHSGSHHNLEDMAFSFARVARYNGSRDCEALFFMDSLRVVKWVRSVIFSDAFEMPAYQVKLPEDVARFNLIFHHSLGYDWLLLITHKGQARIVTASNDLSVCSDFYLDSKFCEYAIEQANAYLQDAILNKARD